MGNGELGTRFSASFSASRRIASVGSGPPPTSARGARRPTRWSGRRGASAPSRSPISRARSNWRRRRSTGRLDRARPGGRGGLLRHRRPAAGIAKERKRWRLAAEIPYIGARIVPGLRRAPACFRIPRILPGFHGQDHLHRPRGQPLRGRCRERLDGHGERHPQRRSGHRGGMRRRLRLRHLPCLCRRGLARKAGEPEPMEEDMLDFAYDVRPNSRLSCQIRVTRRARRPGRHRPRTPGLTPAPLRPPSLRVLRAYLWHSCREFSRQVPRACQMTMIVRLLSASIGASRVSLIPCRPWSGVLAVERRGDDGCRTRLRKAGQDRGFLSVPGGEGKPLHRARRFGGVMSRRFPFRDRAATEARRAQRRQDANPPTSARRGSRFRLRVMCDQKTGFQRSGAVKNQALGLESGASSRPAAWRRASKDARRESETRLSSMAASGTVGHRPAGGLGAQRRNTPPRPMHRPGRRRRGKDDVG